MFESLTGEQKTVSKDICTAWDANALQYLAKGYSVVPLAPKQKGPKLNGWTAYCNVLMDPDTAAKFIGNNNNIGLALGPASGVCAVDIDTDDTEWLKKIEKILPESPVKKRGAKGYTAFYQYNGLPSKSVRNEEGTAGIDFLSIGKQTVLPPSIHPSGKEYTWVTPSTLLTFPKGKLPELSETVLDQLLALFRPRVQRVTTVPAKHYKDANVELVEKALEYINPDQSYDAWIQVGLALQAGFGERVGEDIFVRWSAKGQKFDGVVECAKKFHSFHDPREITISTLFYLASQNGYKGESDFSVEALKAKAQLGESIVAGWTAEDKRVEDRETLKSIITHPVGWMAEVAEWIKKVSMYKQDLFAVASAAAFVSICFAHKFCGRTEARTNNYIVAVGPSGSGKSKICDNVAWLLNNGPQKLRSKLMGDMASSAGLIDELAARDGAALAYMDEIGQFFRFSKADSSSQYTKAIGAEMTKLYSKATDSYTTTAYSAAAKRPVRTIEQPCLVIFGQSVPERLYGALSSADFDDGFFNRFTLIEINDSEKPEKNPDYEMKQNCYPKQIYEFWEHLDAWTSNESMKLNRGNAVVGAPNPLVMVYTDEANRMLDECFDYYNETLPASLEEGDLFAKTLTRAYEQIEKYALVACEFVNDRPVVTAESVKWAKAFVDFHLMGIKYRIRDIADTPYAQECINMKNSLPLNKKMTKQDFNIATRAIHINVRQKMMDDLVTQGVLQYVSDETGTYIVRRI